MPTSNTSPLDATDIGARVRDLRETRRWSQVELAAKLSVSQPRLSKVERGAASLTAEEFLHVLALFNVGLSDFVPASEGSEPRADVQNALLRHGATHLAEASVAQPSDISPLDLLVTVLELPESPRHVAALAPVLVRSTERIALSEAAARLRASGRERRLGWFVDSLHEATLGVVGRTPADQRQLRRARVALDLFRLTQNIVPPSEAAPLDVLDSTIRSVSGAESLYRKASGPARPWRIATALDTRDFQKALAAADVC